MKKKTRGRRAGRQHDGRLLPIRGNVNARQVRPVPCEKCGTQLTGAGWRVSRLNAAQRSYERRSFCSADCLREWATGL